MIRIGVAAALVVGSKPIRAVQRSRRVRVSQSRLPPVGTVEPSQHVVERTVLHHQDDDVLDARFVGERQRRVLANANGAGLRPPSVSSPPVAAAPRRNRRLDR